MSYSREQNGTQLKFVSLLKEEVCPAAGCTAPVAVGLAVAKCCEALGGAARIRIIQVTVSPGIFKNGYSVGIPNSSEKGNLFGAALGAVCGDPSLGLAVFSGVTPEDIEKARALIQRGCVCVSCDPSRRGVYVEAAVICEGDECRTVMNTHSNIVRVILNGRTVFEQEGGDTHTETKVPQDLDIRAIVSFAESVPFGEIAFLLNGVRMNMALARDGLTQPYGLSVGKSLRKIFGERVNYMPELRARMLVSAAADARMGGSPFPAMSTFGSGNQGITAILPVAVLAADLHADEEKTARALAVSHLVTWYVKRYIGRISSMCLCGVAAGAGAGCAVTWLRGGSVRAMEDCVNNLLASLAGMICDGAKGSCALKMGIAAEEAYRASELAMLCSSAGSDDGIIDDDPSVTLRNMERITQATRDSIDDHIVDIINEKSR